MKIRDGLAFRDVLLVPNYSEVLSRKMVTTKTLLSTNIELNIPIISSNMDTVTEDRMAIRMAEFGGIGIIHRFLSIEKQVEMVRTVKRSQHFIIENPYSVPDNITVYEVKQRMAELKVNSFLVTEKDNSNLLIGLVSRRDLLFQEDEQFLYKIMTPYHKLVVMIIQDHVPLEGIEISEIKEIFKKNKIEKIPIVTTDRKIKGLVVIKDICRMMQYPLAVKDSKGRLLVGAAIGVVGDYLERAHELINAGVDILNIDIAHGHHKLLVDALVKVKSEYPLIDVIVGAVATEAASNHLAECGANAIRVGIGPGSHCTTRTVAGCGVPQITAIEDAVRGVKTRIKSNHIVPIIADGGIRGSDDIVKALAAGADSVILGKLLAGCDESPGIVRLKEGKRVKMYRGMASYDAAVCRSKEDENYSFDAINYVPEGVESLVPYQGPVEEVLSQLIGGLHSGMSYLGATTLEQLRKSATFVRLTAAGWDESLTHRG